MPGARCPGSAHSWSAATAASCSGSSRRSERAIGPASLWFLDGHPDYLDGYASDTGETADMDLALLTGVGAEPLVSVAVSSRWSRPRTSCCSAIGHHALDPASAAEVARLPETIRRVDAPGLCADPAAAGLAACDWLDGSSPGSWLHIDLDVLDPASLPAVTYPQPGGPSWDQLAAVLEPLAAAPRLLGVSVADFRPDLDPSGSYAARVTDLLARCLLPTNRLRRQWHD